MISMKGSTMILKKWSNHWIPGYFVLGCIFILLFAGHSIADVPLPGITYFNIGHAINDERVEAPYNFNRRWPQIERNIQDAMTSHPDDILIFQEARQASFTQSDGTIIHFNSRDRITTLLEQHGYTVEDVPYNTTELTFHSIIARPASMQRSDNAFTITEQANLILNPNLPPNHAHHREMPVRTFVFEREQVHITIIAINPHVPHRVASIQAVIQRVEQMRDATPEGINHQFLLFGDLNMFNNDSVTEQMEAVLSEAQFIELANNGAVEGLSNTRLSSTFVAHTHDLFPGFIQLLDLGLYDDIQRTLNTALRESNKEHEVKLRHSEGERNYNIGIIGRAISAIPFEHRTTPYRALANHAAITFPVTGRLDRVYGTSGINIQGDISYRLGTEENIIHLQEEISRIAGINPLPNNSEASEDKTEQTPAGISQDLLTAALRRTADSIAASQRPPRPSDHCLIHFHTQLVAHSESTEENPELAISITTPTSEIPVIVPMLTLITVQTARGDWTSK